MIVVTLPGEPEGKGRPRFRVIAPKGGGRPFASVYTPAETKTYERALGWAGKAAMAGRSPLSAPLAVTVTAIIGVPPSWSNRKRDAALAGAIFATGRPDIDNLVKIGLDGLNGVVWLDDKQIVKLSAEKRYGENPCLEIAVDEIPL